MCRWRFAEGSAEGVAEGAGGGAAEGIGKGVAEGAGEGAAEGIGEGGSLSLRKPEMSVNTDWPGAGEGGDGGGEW